MPLRSMTGFGTAQVQALGAPLSIEIKTLNHRFLDVSFRAPKALSRLETHVIQFFRRNLQRGRVECLITQSAAKSTGSVHWNLPLAREIVAGLRDMGHGLGVLPATAGPTLAELLTFREIFEEADVPTDIDTLWRDVEPGLRTALAGVVASRTREGEALGRDLETRLRNLKVVHGNITTLAAQAAEAHRTRLTAKVQEVLRGADLSDEISQMRLVQEIALLCDRSDVQEELTRLENHLQTFAGLIAAGAASSEEKALGRRLDFLAQELHREINTIGSKAFQEAVIAAVVEGKTELERVREQIQNIE